jgi:spore germination protein KA
MEGRVAIILDGTPAVLTVPYLFIENFQSSEDYYMNFYYTSFSRMLRILGFLLAVAVPGFYIAIGTFHQEMYPLQLFINISTERQSVPLPAIVEAIVMLLVFDIIRETGVRMPSNIGQAFSIVGALVIGQAGVEAKLVAAPMIIVVGLTGITSLLVPKMNAPVIYIRLMLLFLSATFGLIGLVLGLSCVLIHMFNLRSFGVPQMTAVGKLCKQNMKDDLIRAPWWRMILRPVFSVNRVRRNDVGEER